ncbi:MAG: antibiotic biosynthesis monooxygenase family protein [Hyphomicrobiaceae bacterium]|nr:antibiotic biosynthesis monooxygenase family protein [Hyphomicrobiaceae bacterium]
MLALKPFDTQIPIEQQLGDAQSPVILVNTFTFDPVHEAAVLRAWTDDAAWMKQQPGFISTQLHRAVAGSAMYLNYAVWESVEHFRAAFSHPDFRARLDAYPDGVVAAPHLFARIAVPGICTA